MRRPQNLLFVFILALIALSLIACISNPTQNSAASTPLIQTADFAFDNIIIGSPTDDIIKQFGEPDIVDKFVHDGVENTFLGYAYLQFMIADGLVTSYSVWHDAIEFSPLGLNIGNNLEQVIDRLKKLRVPIIEVIMVDAVSYPHIYSLEPNTAYLIVETEAASWGSVGGTTIWITSYTTTPILAIPFLEGIASSLQVSL